MGIWWTFIKSLISIDKKYFEPLWCSIRYVILLKKIKLGIVILSGGLKCSEMHFF